MINLRMQESKQYAYLGAEIGSGFHWISEANVFFTLSPPFGVTGYHPNSIGSYPSWEQCSRQEETPGCGKQQSSSKDPTILASAASQHCEGLAPLTLPSLSASEIKTCFTIKSKAVLDIKTDGLGKCGKKHVTVILLSQLTNSCFLF